MDTHDEVKQIESLRETGCNAILAIVKLAGEKLEELISDDTHLHIKIGTALADVEREVLLRTLVFCGDNRTKATRVLGISPRTMQRKLREYGIPAKYH